VLQALGTDANDLYSHYVNFGKTEGRLPYAPGTDVNSIILAQKESNLTSTFVGHEKLNSSQDVADTKIWGKETIINMVTGKTHTVVSADVNYGDVGLYERIGTPKEGYEWCYASWYFLDSYDLDENIKYNFSDLPIYYCNVDVDNSSNWQRVDSMNGNVLQYVNIGTSNASFEANKGNPVDYAYFTFDVTYNGVTYPALCVVEVYCNEGYAWYMLPKGCSSTRTTILGTKLENNQIKIDRENAHTYIKNWNYYDSDFH
jgi:hypothetical protein